MKQLHSHRRLPGRRSGGETGWSDGFRSGARSRVFNNIFAKELCSCHFVDGLSVAECQSRDNLPPITHQLVNLSVDEDAHSITSSYKAAAEVNAILATSPLRGTQLGSPATAAMDSEHPERGCVLTELSRRQHRAHLH